MEPLPLQEDLRADIAHHDLYDDNGLSEWPSQDTFNDRKRFYMVRLRYNIISFDFFFSFSHDQLYFD